MENRLRSLDTMLMGVKLPLPSDNHQVKVEISAPTYRSVEVVEETGLGSVKTVDFPLLYEWASRESRITGYSKLYLLAGYLVNYQNGTGEPTEGTHEDQEVHLRIELKEQIKIETLDLEKADNFMSRLYRIIREYEAELHDMILSADLEETQMEELIKWPHPSENLPALPGEVAPLPVENSDPFDWEPSMEDLIELAHGEYITRGKLIAEYEKLKSENEDLRALRDSKYGKYVELFEKMMAGNDCGISFVALCLEEVQNQLQKAASTSDCFKSLHNAADKMEEGAQLWGAMAQALKNLAPKPVAKVQNYKVNSNDFRDVSQFVFACSAYAMDEKKPLRVRVFKDSLNNEVAEFDWQPGDAGMGYNPQEAKAFVLSTLMDADLSLGSGCHHLAAFAPNSDACIAAHTVWL